MRAALGMATLALLLGGVALLAALSGRGAPGPERDPPALARAAPNAELRARLDALASENRDLRERLALLEARPAPDARAPATAGLATVEELEALRAELRAAVAARARPDEGAGDAAPVFKERVAETLSEIRHEEAVAKVRSQQERRLERLDETMPKVEEWLGLSPYQSDRMRSALLVQYEREAELVRRWEAGEDPELLGERKVADREQHLAEVAAFLSAQQYETYAARVGGK